MKKWMVALTMVALLAIPPSVFAQGSATATGWHTAPWSHVQLYYDWGPACYYGQDVRVVYNAQNTWSYIVEGDITETLIHDGTATVYDMNDNLIETRPFYATEYFFDANGDVAIRHDYGPFVWYQVSHNASSSALEQYNYSWEISGVYSFHFWNSSGNWGGTWTSGDCQVIFPGE